VARDFPDSYEPIPVDRVAGRVLSTGYHHEFTKTDQDREVWEIPPEVVPLYLVPPTIRELFGKRKGSLLVVGYLGRRRTNGGNQGRQKLLVRCDCGRHEIRNAQKWRQREVGGEDYCQLCARRERLKTRNLPGKERDRLRQLYRTLKGVPTCSEQEALNNKRRKAYTERLLMERLTYGNGKNRVRT
jgi:hypothetical protein